jgi:thimet oligopeptidase
MNTLRGLLYISAFLLLGACDRQPDTATNQQAQTPAQPEPAAAGGLVAVYRIPELEKLQTAEALSAACASEVASLKEWLGLLEKFEGVPTVENYLEPYNAVLVSATNMAYTAGSLAGVSPDEGVRNAGDDCSQSLTSVFSDYALSRPLYDRVSQVDVAAADADTQRFVEKQLRAFHLSGVDKDDATRARIKALNEELTVVGQEFDNNIRDSVLYLELDSVEQLEGLPQDYIDAHPPGEDGKIRISTQYPDLFPFMSYAKSDELRYQLAVLRNNLAFPKNQAVLEKLLALRFELAQLLGFENYAQWVTADKMAGSPQRVESFLEEIKGYTTESQGREYAMLLARLQQDKPGAERVESWQASYLQEKVKAEQYNVDSKAVREYFSYNHTRDGIFMLVQDLFKVQIKPWKTYTWDESVEAYELWDGDHLIGNFFLDMHPRPNKYQHAAQFPLRSGISGVQTPLSALVCNFPSGDGLMEHGDVETFLHEFGHLIHAMFSGGHHWADVSGISTEWDFVEAPSQMLEEWVWDYDTLSQFARNSAGEPIPRAMLDRMIAARDFSLGLDTRRQLSLAAMSMGLYDRDPQGLDIKAFTDGISREYTPFEPLKDGHFYAAFGHLNGYSAIYYTYQWSLAIAADMFTRFKQEGLRNVETAGEYRDRVLSQGGAKPAAQLLRDFLGRDISFKPYADRLSAGGQPAAEVQ